MRSTPVPAASTDGSIDPSMLLVGGVGQLYQGDHDLGRLAIEALAREVARPDVSIEDLYYGAVAVAQRLQELRPAALILIGTEERGRAPGTVERRLISTVALDPESVQRAVGDAVVGYVTLDLTVEVVAGLDALPDRTIVFEVEPGRTTPSEELTPECERALAEVVDLVRREIDRSPLFGLARDLEHLLKEQHLQPSPALDTLGSLLEALRKVDAHGAWGSTFSLRDRLRRDIADGRTGEGMSHLDWGLWWALIEELDQLQSADVPPGS